jgi:hypothetical protein
MQIVFFFPDVTRFVSYTDEKNKTFNLDRLDRVFFNFFFEHLFYFILIRTAAQSTEK